MKLKIQTEKLTKEIPPPPHPPPPKKKKKGDK
jgi:hypothetical protein